MCFLCRIVRNKAADKLGGSKSPGSQRSNDGMEPAGPSSSSIDGSINLATSVMSVDHMAQNPAMYTIGPILSIPGTPGQGDDMTGTPVDISAAQVPVVEDLSLPNTNNRRKRICK